MILTEFFLFNKKQVTELEEEVSLLKKQVDDLREERQRMVSR